MNLTLPLTDGVDDGDQVARQRRKRAQRLLHRSVAGFDDLTLNDVLRSVVAATEESEEPLNIERFLAERGHAWQTVGMVIACLPSIDEHRSSYTSPQGGPDGCRDE